MPGGTRNGVGGLSFSAICMKSRKIGAGILAGRWRALPSERGLS